MRTGDEATRALLAPVLDEETAIALAAERAFLRVLDGSCKTPIGAHARIEGGCITFRAIVLKPDGSQFFETAASGPLRRRGLARRSGRPGSRGANSRRFFRSLASRTCE